MRHSIIIGAMVGAILATPAAAQPANRDLPNTLGDLRSFYSDALREEHQLEAKSRGAPDVRGVYSLLDGGTLYNRTRNAGIGNGAEGSSHEDESGDEDPGLAGFDWWYEDGGGGPARAGYDNGNSDPLTNFDNRRDDQ